MSQPNFDNEDGEGRGEVQVLRDELDRLRKVVEQQADEIAAVGGKTIKQELGGTPMAMERSPTKPRDVPILELNHLEGIEAAARLQMFIELIEQISAQDETRVKIAKSRLSPEIAMLVHNRQQHLHLTWSSFCRLLTTEFAVEVNVDRAWQDLDVEQYDWGEESPQAFSNRFVCKYAVLETKFPGESFPNQEKTIKRKIWRGLPREVKERTEGFLEEDYPLKKFMERVDYQRQLWLDGQVPGINQIQPESKKTNKGTPEKNKESEELIELRQQVANLTQSLNQLQIQGRRTPEYQTPPPRERVKPRPMERRWPPSHPPKFCAYCQTNSHTLDQCRKAPGPGRCFDCHRENCRRGNPGCPKGVNRQI